LLNSDYEFSVDRMKGKIFNLAPINKGWAIIGRSDKYLGGCTYTIVGFSENAVELLLDESGPIIIYSANRKPKTKQGELTEMGNGFYEIDLPVGELNKKITVQR